MRRVDRRGPERRLDDGVDDGTRRRRRDAGYVRRS